MSMISFEVTSVMVEDLTTFDMRPILREVENTRRHTDRNDWGYMASVNGIRKQLAQIILSGKPGKIFYMKTTVTVADGLGGVIELGRD